MEKLNNINFKEIPEDELINELDNFYLNTTYVRLQALNNPDSTSFLDVVGKTNSESIHSNFLKWLLENKNFIKNNTSPLKNLILLALRKAKNEQIICKNGKNLETFSDGMRTNKFKSIDNIIIEREQTVMLINDPMKKTKRSVDLVVECSIGCNKVRIIIENKIWTFEHDSQCKAYEIFYDNEIKDPADFTIFIFLAPYTVDLSHPLTSDKFISIEYQSILDFIIEPILESEIYYDRQSISHLKQYFKALTSMDNNQTIAVSNKYKELLKQFYNENRDLILTAMKYSGDDVAVELANKNLANSAAAQSGLFEIIYNGQTSTTVTTLADLFYYVVLHIANSGKYTAQQLASLFAQIPAKYASKDLITLTPPTDKNGLPNNRHLTSVKKRSQIFCNGQPIYVSNQIAFDKENNKDNTTPFINFINENKNKFGIEVKVN